MEVEGLTLIYILAELGINLILVKLKILLFFIFLFFIVLPTFVLGYLLLQSLQIKTPPKDPQKIQEDVAAFTAKTETFGETLAQKGEATLEITDEELESLALQKIPKDSPLKDVSVDIQKDKIITDIIFTRIIDFRLHAEAGVTTQANILVIDPEKITFAGIPLPTDQILNRISLPITEPIQSVSGVKIENGKIFLDLNLISGLSWKEKFKIKEIKIEEGKIILSASSQP